MAIISFQEVVLDNNQKFHYTVNPFEMKNSLGKVIALLQEYVITTSDTIPEPSYFKLYKTKEGYCYEIEAENSKPQKIIRQLKSAINSIEKGFENNGTRAFNDRARNFFRDVVGALQIQDFARSPETPADRRDTRHRAAGRKRGRRRYRRRLVRRVQGRIA